MKTETITIKTSLAPELLMKTLSAITITDIAKLNRSPHAVYYGELKENTFDIKNVRYGPMSSAPNIQGEIQEGEISTIVKVRIDINSHYKILRAMYYSTLIPIGIIILLLSILVLGGTGIQLQGYLFSCSFIVCAFIFVAIMKSSLINMKKKELKEFVSRVNGHIVTANELKILPHTQQEYVYGKSGAL